MTQSENGKLQRVVFLFQLFDRRYERQIFRILKRLYHRDHFYYLHVDFKSKYLRAKLNQFQQKLIENNIRNVIVCDKPIKVTWGAASMLHMQLHVFKHLLELRATSEWDWDYMINLSEADYPIRSIDEITLFFRQFQHGENIIFFDYKKMERHNQT